MLQQSIENRMHYLSERMKRFTELRFSKVNAATNKRKHQIFLSFVLEIMFNVKLLFTDCMTFIALEALLAITTIAYSLSGTFRKFCWWNRW